MTPDQYLKESARTENTPSFLRDSFSDSVVGTNRAALLHASLGMQTECAEFADAMKKNLIYGKILDEINLTEELGDILWYIALACRTMGVTFEQLFDQNTAKLKVRFPEKFTEEKALNRDLEAERKALEK